MTYTDPSAFTFVDAAANGADLDTYVLDNVEFLATSKPYCAVTRTTDYTIASSGSFESVTCDTVLVDTDSMSDGTGITITRTGYYIVQFGAFFESGTYNKNAQVVDNTGRVIVADYLLSILTATDAHLGKSSHPVLLTAAQTIQLEVRRDGDDTKVIYFRSEDSPILSVSWYAEPA